MAILKLEALQQAELRTTPFDHCIVRNFVEADALAQIHRDFPDLNRGGSHPLSALKYGESFGLLTDELLGSAVQTAFATRFGLDLTDRPTTLTVRGQTRRKDGKIHLDSKSKLITVLLYLNEDWQAETGRLRLLRSNNIEDVLLEVTPTAGTLVAFRCTRNAWHGHKPFEGPRRSIQLNWVLNQAAANRSHRRHSLSHIMKRYIPGWHKTEDGKRRAG